MANKKTNKSGAVTDVKITAPTIPFSLETAKQHSFAVQGIEQPKQLYVLPFLPPTPFSTVKGDYRSGFEFTYDAAAIISTFNAEKRPLILDVDHNSEFSYVDTRARGWIYSLFEANEYPELNLEEGMYAAVELTKLGLEELGEKLYGFTSSVVLPEGSNATHFVRAKSLALTNNPATKMPTAFSSNGDGSYTKNNDVFQSTTLEEETMDKTQIITTFGLAADASESQILTALVAFKAKLATTETELTTAKAAIEKFTAEKFEADCNAAVDEAIKAKKITPGQRESMFKLATVDLEAFKTAMGAAVEVVSSTTAPVDENTDQTFGLTTDELAFASKFNITAKDYAEAKKSRFG